MATIKIYGHCKGYYQSRCTIRFMDWNELLNLIDNLYGRNNLPEDYSNNDLLQEALRQNEIEWRRLPERLQL